MSDLKKIANNFLPKDKKQWSVFLSCVVISSLLWMLLKFSEEREEEVMVQIEFINLPKNQLVVGETPQSFPVKIKAQGFELISQGVGLSTPVVKIDLTKTKVVKRKNYNEFVWLPKHNEKQIMKSFGAEVKSLTYPLDSVKLRCSPMVVKELITKFRYTLSNQTEHFKVGLTSESPAKVKVLGAKAILAQLDTIYTEVINFDQLQSNLDADYPLEKMEGIDSIFQDSIRVFIDVESIEKYKFEIPIEVKNAPDSLEVKMFPPNVIINFTCGTHQFSQITPSDFKPYIDFNEIDPSFKKLPINLDDKPSVVGDLRIEPYSVDFLLRSKD